MANWCRRQPVVGCCEQVVTCPASSASNVRFLFIGDGIFRERLEQQIAAAGLTDYFQFTGLVPPERIPGVDRRDGHCGPRQSPRGPARVLPQALIAGKPVVSYDVDGAREVVISGETGFLVPPRNVDELAARLSSLRPIRRCATGLAKRAAGDSPTISATST